MTLSSRPATYFDAVGRVARASAAMETSGQVLYQTLLQSPVGAVVTLGQPFHTVHQGILSVIPLIGSGEIVARTERALGDARVQYTQRTQILSGVYHPDDEGDTRTLLLAGPWGDTQSHPWTVDTIYELAGRLVSAGSTLMQLNREWTLVIAANTHDVD